MNNRNLMHFGRCAGIALAGLLTLLASGSARAFSYSPGDLVGIFVDGNTELYVNLGQVDLLTSVESFLFPTPAGFGSDGATGAKFIAYSTDAPFSGSLNRNLTFTVQAGVDPSSYDSNISGYVNRIGLAQLALDDGDAAPDRFFQLLNNFPLAGTGGVISNTVDVLAILTSNTASYTSTIGVNGSSDRINNNLPFETDNLIGLNTQIELWNAVKISNLQAVSSLLARMTIEGNVAAVGQPPMTRITFAPAAVPLPHETKVAIMLGAIAALWWKYRYSEREGHARS